MLSKTTSELLYVPFEDDYTIDQKIRDKFTKKNSLRIVLRTYFGDPDALEGSVHGECRPEAGKSKKGKTCW